MLLFVHLCMITQAATTEIWIRFIPLGLVGHKVKTAERLFLSQVLKFLLLHEAFYIIVFNLLYYYQYHSVSEI